MADSAPGKAKAAAVAAATRTLLQSLWERNLPLLRERLGELDRAATAAGNGTLTAGTRSAAAATAHKLSGSLGMFGYPEGTEHARTVERALDAGEPVDAATLQQAVQALRAALPL